MSKFYVYDNASRRLKSGAFTFDFDVVEQFAGAWRGILKLDDADKIAALESFASRLGVREITEDEYNGWLKKKLNSSRPSPSIIHPPTPSQGLAVAAVVKSPLKLTTPNSTVESRSKPSVEDAVVIGVAPYNDPLELKSGSKKVRPRGK